MHRLPFVLRGLLAALVAPLLALGPLAAPMALGQTAGLDPRAIALTPDDLAPGFAFVPEQVVLEPLPGDFAWQLKTEMRREPTAEALRTGPVIVDQIIIRIDRMVVPSDFLNEVRRNLLEQQGFQLVPGAPNDGGTASLVKQDATAAVYAVGFVKNEMVVFTIGGGLPGVVTLDTVLTLAGISSARYDSAAR